MVVPYPCVVWREREPSAPIPFAHVSRGKFISILLRLLQYVKSK